MCRLSEIIREIKVNKNRTLYVERLKRAIKGDESGERKSNARRVWVYISTWVWRKGKRAVERLKTNNPLNGIQTNERTTEMSEMNEVDVTSI